MFFWYYKYRNNKFNIKIYFTHREKFVFSTNRAILLNIHSSSICTTRRKHLNEGTLIFDKINLRVVIPNKNKKKRRTFRYAFLQKEKEKNYLLVSHIIIGVIHNLLFSVNDFVFVRNRLYYFIVTVFVNVFISQSTVNYSTNYNCYNHKKVKE